MSYPFDERNQRDYEALSARLIAGLDLISDERAQDGSHAHQPKVHVLARLAGCSVATLYTRRGTTPIDPIDRLSEIKRSRSLLTVNEPAPRPRRVYVTKDHVRPTDELVIANRQLQADLANALDEATRWHCLYLDLMQVKLRVDEHNARLVEKLALIDKSSQTVTGLEPVTTVLSNTSPINQPAANDTLGDRK